MAQGPWLEVLLAEGVIARALREAPTRHRYTRVLDAKMTLICVLVACLFPEGGSSSEGGRPLLRIAATAVARAAAGAGTDPRPVPFAPSSPRPRPHPRPHRRHLLPALRRRPASAGPPSAT